MKVEIFHWEEITFKDPVLPIRHCMLRSLGGHFCDVENSEAFVCGQNRTLYRASNILRGREAANFK